MSLTPEQLQAVEEAANAAARRVLSAPEVSDLVASAVRQTLLQLGIDAADPLEMQKDFQHLRDWRTSTTELKRKGLLALLGIVLSGFLGLVLLGFRDWLAR